MTTPIQVTVVRTGTANLGSVVASLERLGCTARVTTELPDIQAADRLVLPGVGSLAAARATLDRHDLADGLRERMLQGRPTLGICLGMQLMAQSSEEAPGVAGLGVMGGRVTAYPERDPPLHLPQMGWNRVDPAPGCRVVPGGYAYFANSYRLARVAPPWIAATSDFGGAFVSAVENGPVVGCQFHPELSGAYGAALLARWIRL